MSNRRHFLFASAAAAVGASLPRTLFAQRLGGDVFSNRGLGGYWGGQMTQTTFESVLGSSFRIYLENNQVGNLTLLKVTGADDAATSVTPAAGSGRLTSNARIGIGGTFSPTPKQPVQTVSTFQLTFATNGAIFEQDSYLLDHGTLGQMAVFIVPDRAGSGTATAVFSYLQNSQTKQGIFTNPAPTRTPSTGITSPIITSGTTRPVASLRTIQ